MVHHACFPFSSFRLLGPACSLGVLALASVLSGSVQAQDSVRANDIPTLPGIQVTAPHGSALRDARRRASVGPLGERELLDTPYSISVVPARQLQDQQTRNLQDALRNLPWAQGDGARPQTRGVQGAVIENSHADGFNIVSTTDIPLELYEQVEVINGVAGTLYGPSTGAGQFELTQKRAAIDGNSSLTLGIDDNIRPIVHADVWTPFTRDKRWRLRVNAVQESGDGYVDDSRKRRSLAGLALDGDITSRTRLQMNLSYYEYKTRGFPGRFGVVAGVPFPEPVDPRRVGYGQPYSGNFNDTTTATLRVLHRLESGWRLAAGISRQIADRESTTITHTVRNLLGDYVSTSGPPTASRFTVTGNQLSLNGQLKTGSVTHDMTLANHGFDWQNFNPKAGRNITLGSASIDAPALYAEPRWPDFTDRYRSAAQRQQSITLADVMSFDEHWQLMGSLSYSWLHLKNYSQAGVQTRDSSDSGLSPFVGLVFKPTQRSSLYLSYGDTLQPGTVAPSGTANEGQVLDPYRSKQWELGYKTRVGAFDLSTALFRIQRPFGYADTNQPIDGKPLFHTTGKQLNHGLELGLSGDVTHDLSIVAGLAWLDPRMKQTATESSNDKRIVGLSRWSASLYADWRVPGLQGLRLTGRLTALDKRPANYANTDWISGYTLVDLGLIYQHRLAGQDLTWRLNVNNLSDKRYWTNVVAGGPNGYSGSGNESAAVGNPRTLMLSVQWKL